VSLLTRFRAVGSGRRWRLAGAAAVGAAVLVVGPVTAASAQTASASASASADQRIPPPLEYPDPWNDYQTLRCLDSNAAGVAYTNPCWNPDNYQLWAIYETEYSGALTFNDDATGLCLDSNYSGNVYTDSCNGDNTYQNWTLGGEGPAYTIQDYQTGLCLDSNGSGSVYTDPCNWNNAYQNWEAQE
jgi:Ricin-type beta-trefoil lectin domain